MQICPRRLSGGKIKPMKNKCLVLLACLLTLAQVGCSGSGNVPLPTNTYTNVDTDAGTADSAAGTEPATTISPTTDPATPKDPWHYGMWNSVKIREVTIDSGRGGDPVTVIQLTDLHLAAMTQADLENPTLASTAQYRKWGANGRFAPNATVSLDYADSQKPDQIVITGDATDYLSGGSLELLKETVWDRYRDADGKVSQVLISLGNHERVQQMQGKVKENLSDAEREKMVADAWEHDILYTSRILKEKVMVIQMDNGLGYFREEQVPFLQADLALAREKGYTVLLFFHEAISTGNVTDMEVSASYVGAGSADSANFYTGGTVANPYSKGVNGEIYQLIVNSADVVGGVFCGHLHADFYTEILAKTPEGQAKVIPQYVLTGTPYDKGHALKITVR